jgi:hypothetical protein
LEDLEIDGQDSSKQAHPKFLFLLGMGDSETIYNLRLILNCVCYVNHVKISGLTYSYFLLKIKTEGKKKQIYLFISLYHISLNIPTYRSSANISG